MEARRQALEQLRQQRALRATRRLETQPERREARRGQRVNVVDERRSREGRSLGTQIRPQQQIVRNDDVDRILLDRGQHVAGEGQGRPHHRTVA